MDHPRTSASPSFPSTHSADAGENCNAEPSAAFDLFATFDAFRVTWDGRAVEDFPTFTAASNGIRAARLANTLLSETLARRPS